METCLDMHLDMTLDVSFGFVYSHVFIHEFGHLSEDVVGYVLRTCAQARVWMS